MKRRFTRNELFRLRNLIPIDTLIRDQLDIPSKFSEGFFRFLCPVCNEFRTATSPSTNLARCFRCEKNFNPIDMVMIVKKMGFVESVKYLKNLLPDTPHDPAALVKGPRPKQAGQSNTLAAGRKDAVSAIGEILKNLSLKAG